MHIIITLIIIIREIQYKYPISVDINGPNNTNLNSNNCEGGVFLSNYK